VASASSASLPPSPSLLGKPTSACGIPLGRFVFLALATCRSSERKYAKLKAPRCVTNAEPRVGRSSIDRAAHFFPPRFMLPSLFHRRAARAALSSRALISALQPGRGGAEAQARFTKEMGGKKRNAASIWLRNAGFRVFRCSIHAATCSYMLKRRGRPHSRWNSSVWNALRCSPLKLDLLKRLLRRLFDNRISSARCRRRGINHWRFESKRPFCAISARIAAARSKLAKDDLAISSLRDLRRSGSAFAEILGRVRDRDPRDSTSFTRKE